MKLVSKMQQIGLSAREAEVYIALLQKREFTAAELGRITTVTRTKIYEILQKMILKGVCNEKLKDGQKLYRAVKPDMILKNVIANLELEIKQRKEAAKERARKEAKERERKDAIEQMNLAAIEQKKITVVSLAKELNLLYEDKRNNLDPIDYIEVLSDARQIKERWLTLQNNVKKEMLVFTKTPYILKLSENKTPEKLTLEKKINIMAIYEHYNLKEESMPDFIKMLDSFSKMGEEIRIIRTLPMKLAIFDEKVTMLALKDPVSMESSITTMIVDHSSFAISLKKVFESYWADSISLNDFKKLKQFDVS